MRERFRSFKLAPLTCNRTHTHASIHTRTAEDGIFEDGAPAVKLSKKEQEAAYNARKHKQGVRTAKTGPKSASKSSGQAASVN